MELFFNYVLHYCHSWFCAKISLHLLNFSFVVGWNSISWLITQMWSPLFCPSSSHTVTACWLDLEGNHHKIMTQCWSLEWPAELLPAVARHDVAECPCLLFGYVCFCVSPWVWQSSIQYRYAIKQMPDRAFTCQWVVLQSVRHGWQNANATESAAINACLLCIYMCRHLHEPEEHVCICILNPRVGKWPVSCDYILGNQKWRGNCEIYLKEL